MPLDKAIVLSLLIIYILMFQLLICLCIKFLSLCFYHSISNVMHNKCFINENMIRFLHCMYIEFSFVL